MLGRRLVFICIILCLILTTAFLIFEIKLFPIIEKMAIAEGKNLATATLNESIYSVIRDNGADDVVLLEYGDSGEIVSLTTDATRVNLIKSMISCDIESRLSDNPTKLKIPLGSLTGIKLLSGRGPDICIKALPVRSVTTDIGAVFLEAGINQTWHRVVLNVSLDLDMLVLSHAIDCHVSDTVVLTDTVIVGRVPDAYTDINKIEDELLGDVVDFSASSN